MKAEHFSSPSSREMKTNVGDLTLMKGMGAIVNDGYRYFSDQGSPPNKSAQKFGKNFPFGREGRKKNTEIWEYLRPMGGGVLIFSKMSEF